MAVKSIALPEISAEDGLESLPEWRDDWRTYLGRSKYYHAYECAPGDLPEAFPTEAMGYKDVATARAAFAEASGCSSEIRLQQANMTLYCDLKTAVKSFPLLRQTVKAAKTYRQSMLDLEALQQGH